VGKASCPGEERPKEVATGGSLHTGKIRGGSDPGANRRRDVTAEQKQRIRDIYAATGNGHEVARQMELGSTTVYNHLGLGGRKPRWTDEEDQAVIDGYAESRKVSDIAKAIGRSRGAVAVHMCRHRKEVKHNPKKRRALSAISLAFKAVRKADIFRELEA